MPSLLQFRWFLINADIVIIHIRKFKNSSACLNTIKKIKKGYTKSLWKISKPLWRRKEKNQYCVIVTKISQKNKIISWLSIEKTTMKWEKRLIIVIRKYFHLEKFLLGIRFFFFFFSRLCLKRSSNRKISSLPALWKFFHYMLNQQAY